MINNNIYLMYQEIILQMENLLNGGAINRFRCDKSYVNSARAYAYSVFARDLTRSNSAVINAINKFILKNCSKYNKTY